MARAATREMQELGAYRTGPQRKPSGFQPAQRVTAPPPREEEEEEERPRTSSLYPGGGPTTKSGYPDRRYRGQRDLPPPPQEEGGTKARTGGVVGDIHVTIDGKPDRRFKENRHLSEEEVMSQWLETMNERYGRPPNRR